VEVSDVASSSGGGSSDNKLSAGAIAGVAIGVCFVLFVFINIGLYRCYHKPLATPRGRRFLEASIYRRVSPSVSPSPSPTPSPHTSPKHHLKVTRKGTGIRSAECTTSSSELSTVRQFKPQFQSVSEHDMLYSDNEDEKSSEDDEGEALQARHRGAEEVESEDYVSLTRFIAETRRSEPSLHRGVDVESHQRETSRPAVPPAPQGENAATNSIRHHVQSFFEPEFDRLVNNLTVTIAHMTAASPTTHNESRLRRMTSRNASVIPFTDVSSVQATREQRHHNIVKPRNANETPLFEAQSLDECESGRQQSGAVDGATQTPDGVETVFYF
jgi:hypothetical protein